MSGKSIEYYTLLWKSVRAFSIETAGSFLDRDSELLLYTNVPDAESSAPGFPRKNRTRFSIDFRKGGADLFAVKRYISDKLLGADPSPPSRHAISNAGVADSGSGNPFAWLGNDSRMIDGKSHISESWNVYVVVTFIPTLGMLLRYSRGNGSPLSLGPGNLAVQ
jgi:hypothetical protein